MDNPLMVVIIGIAVGILIFLLIRELVCWYFKINDMKDLLEKILEELQTLNGHKTDNNSEEDSKKSENSKKDKPVVEEQKKEDSDDDDNDDPDEPVEDPFWNKR